MVDIDKNHNARLQTWVDKKDGQRVVRARAWADTTVYGVQVSWIALQKSPVGS
jgi:hypothetical protein